MNKLSRVGVFPRGSQERFAQLFAALERAFHVRFVEPEIENIQELDAAMVFTGSSDLIMELSTAAVPTYCITSDQSHAPSPEKLGQVQFSETKYLNQYLRGRALEEALAHQLPALQIQENDAVLATASEKPIWVLRHLESTTQYIVSCPPEELTAEEVLRDHLFPRRFIGLLPLIHFLREVSDYHQWTPPKLRACLLFDDPNLHSARYGYIDYQDMVAHAEQHNYHAAMATVPLDSWFANKRAVKLFREHSDRLSLLIHGNNHIHHELEQPLNDEQCVAQMAQALQRIERLEQKTGLNICRVMVAPHGRYNDAMMRAMHVLNFDAACANLSYAWRVNAAQGEPLGAWRPVDLVTGGFPVLIRKSMYEDHEDIVLRAFLDLPIILYGHHGEAADNMELLAMNANMVNSLGDVQWTSMSGIARTNYMSKQEANTLHIRLHTGTADIMVPDDVQQLAATVPQPIPELIYNHLLVGEDRVAMEGDAHSMVTQSVPVRPGKPVQVRLLHPHAVSYQNVSTPKTSVWPVMRRILAETRDRLQPVIN